MPPAHKRNVDDSRSETSSSVPNHKEVKSNLGTNSGSGTSKAKRLISSALNGSAAKASVNGTAALNTASVSTAPVAPATVDKDPNLPRTEWAAMPNSILRTYRVAHRLPVPSTYSQPHADITYNSSQIALRAPSAILARRRLRDEKHRRRKLDQVQATEATTKGKTKTKDRHKGKEKDLKVKDINLDASSVTGSHIAQSIEPPDATQDSSGQTQPSHPPSSPSSTSTTYLGPREPASQLAVAVRKHFNAQQLSEADTIARFAYVVQQGGRPVWTEGCEGDGAGNWMGSHGREVRKVDGPGGEVGFRLRFRP